MLGLNAATGGRSLGFIYWPALLGVVIASMMLAPIGVAVSHYVRVPTLKKLFAGVTVVIGLKMAGGFTVLSAWLAGLESL